jgi:hypothetical protein
MRRVYERHAEFADVCVWSEAPCACQALRNEPGCSLGAVGPMLGAGSVIGRATLLLLCVQGQE